jgi:hypothetical protein
MIEPDINEQLADFSPSQNIKDMLYNPALQENLSMTEAIMPRAPMPLPAAPKSPALDPALQAAVDEMASQRSAVMNASLYNASKKNPDTAGEAQRLAQQMGVGADIAERNLEEMRRGAAMVKALDRNLATSAPKTANALTEPNFANIAFDDLENLTGAEKLMRWFAGTDFFKGAQGTFIQTEMSIIDQLNSEGMATAKDFERYKELQRDLQIVGAPKEGSWTGSFGNILASVGAGVPDAAEWAITGAAVGGAAGTIGGPFAPATVPAGIMLGGSAGFATGMAKWMYQVMAGESYRQLREAEVPHDVAVPVSRGVGVITSALEFAGLGAEVWIASGVGKKLFAKEVATEVNAKLLQELTRRATLRGAVYEGAKLYVGEMLAESTVEATQTLITRVGTELARSYSRPDLQNMMQTPEGRRKIIGEAVDAFVTTAKGMALMGAPLPAVNFYIDRSRAADAQRSQKFYEDLSKNAVDSKVRQRNPDAAERHFAAVMDGTGAETTYVNAHVMQNILNQAGVTAEQVDSVLPGLSRQLADALAQGGDVTMPTATWAAKLAGTKLGDAMKPHMRPNAQAWSADTAAKYQAEVEQRKAEALAIEAEKETTDSTFVDEARAVEKEALTQLEAAGQDKKLAKLNARIYRDMVVVMAANPNRNQTPAQVHAEIGPDIFGPQGEQVAPGATAAPVFAVPAVENLPRPPKPEGMEQEFYDALIARAIKNVGNAGTVDLTFGVRPEGSEMDMPLRVEANLRAAGNNEAADVYIEMARRVADRNIAAFQERRAAETAAAAVPLEQAAISRMDADYLAAVERGDMATAQLETDRAAEMAMPQSAVRGDGEIGVAGKLLRVFHGSGAFIRQFMYEFTGQGVDQLGSGFYFTTDRDEAVSYTTRRGQQDLPKLGGEDVPTVVEAYLDIRNPLDASATGSINSKQVQKFIELAPEESRREGLENWGIDGDKPSAKVLNAYAFTDANIVRELFKIGNDFYGRNTEAFNRAIKQVIGYDGVVQDFRVDGVRKLHYVAFFPEQIKSADPVTYDEQGNIVPLSRRFDITSPKLFEQAAAGPRLMAIHNLSADNLAFAERMGGLAVPSIGVVTEQAGGVEGFGEITLIGSREMADPSTSRVFEADAYSARFPQPEWPKVPVAKADKFVQRLREVSKKYDDSSIVDVTFDGMVNNPDASKISNYWMRSSAAMALFLRDKGIEIEPRMRVPSTLSGLDWNEIDALRPVYNAVNQNQSYDDMEASPEYAALQEAYANAIRAKYAPIADEMPAGRVEKYATEFGPGTMSRLQRDMQQTDRNKVSYSETRDALETAIQPYQAEFKTWVDSTIREQFGAPFIRDGKLKKPYTLGNIVDAMTSAKVKGEEKGMTFGAGAARAAASKEFVDLEQMREAASTAIVDPEKYAEESKKSAVLLEAYRNAMADYSTLSNWRGQIDTWAALDGSMRAIAKYGNQKRKSEKAMRDALRREGFDVSKIPSELIDQAIEAASALYTAPVPYFEAKPQRAVGLGEFKGAVIPSNTSAETRSILERNNIPFVEYGSEQTRTADVRKFVDLLERGGKSVLFQAMPKSNEPRGQYDANRIAILLNTKASATTFFHELIHWRMDMAIRMVNQGKASAQEAADVDTLFKSFGIAGDTPQERLATWNKMSIEQQRPHWEAVAYNSEIYLFEGKAPSVEMQGVFDRLHAFVKRVYVSIKTELNALYRKEFGKDLPILTGEVREVMDRWLASEEQIQRKQAMMQMVPLFLTQEESGMDDATWAEHQQANKDAEEAAVTDLTKASLRQMEWLSGARSRILKKLQSMHDDLRKKTRAEVMEEVKNEPVYAAMSILKTGEGSAKNGELVKFDDKFKLNLEMVKKMLPEEQVRQLGYGKYGMVAADGIAPDMVAEMVGFSSGDELVLAILAAKPLKEEVDARTDRRMMEEHGELNTPQAMEEAVQRALHNEARVRFNAVYVRFLSKSTAPVQAFMDATKLAARQIIAGKVIRDLRPGDHQAAEAKAAREAADAHKGRRTAEQAAQAAATRERNVGLSAAAAGVPMTEVEAAAAAKGQEAAQRVAEREAEYKAKYGDRTPEQVMLRAKQIQLLQNQLAREAQEAKDEVANAVKDFRKFFKADDKLAKTRNMDLVDAARAILSAFGFGKSDKSPAEYIDKLKAYNAEMYAAIEPLVMAATSGSKNYKDLTVEQFRQLREVVDALWEQSRRDKLVEIDGKMVALADVVGELETRLDEIGVPENVIGDLGAATYKERRILDFYDAKAAIRRVEHWADATDGAKGVGPFTKYIWRPIKDAINAYRMDRNKYVLKYVQLLKQVVLPVGKIESKELNYTFGNGKGGVGKAELLGALMHTGNDSNKKKLLVGRGWGSINEDGTLDSSRWDAFVARMIKQGVLTKSDFDFVQATWDLCEEIKPIAQKAHRAIFGFYFKEIQATSFTNEFGTFRGGYVPAKTDAMIVRDAKRQSKMEELEGDFRNSMPSTGMGFTQSREEQYNEALSMDVRLVTKHIDDVLRFAHVQPAIKDVLKILKNRSFSSKLTRMDPTVIDDMLIPWLNRSARQITSEPGRNKPMDKFWKGVRSRTGLSIMTANLRNALQQPTGFFPAMLKVSKTQLGNALLTYLGSPLKTANEVASLSTFMNERLQSQIFDMQDDINEILLNPNAYNKVQKWTERHGYFLQSAFQNMVDVVVWTAKYNQVLAESKIDASDTKVQREAIQQADAAVRLTQGSMSAEDISAFEVGTPFYETFNQFGGYFNMLANLNADEYIKVIRDLGWRGNKGKLLNIYILGFMAPTLIADAIARSMGGGWDDDDDGYLDDVLDWFFGSQARAAVAMVPFGSTAATAITTAFDSKAYNDRISASPSIVALEASTIGVGKTIINIADDDKEIEGKNVRDVLTLISLATGTPVTVLGRPVGYLVDVNRKKIKPTGPIDVARGLVTGVAGGEKKKN